MYFALLGPLVVRVGESPVPVSADKQRVLLAALLVRANQVVPPSYLAEAVWEGRPPKTARVTLQNYVMRLRQALGPAGHEWIVTRPTGYLIQAGPADLDLLKFAELRASGLAAAHARAWDVASQQLSAALSLWRGQPLLDVPSQVLTLAEVPRLTEMRLDAIEARIDADLNLGRHREAVAELGMLAAAEPLRERLHELLMLALYRSGQQAAALAVYRKARQHLLDELGIDPGPGLRRLNHQILNSDAVLLPPLVAAGPHRASTGHGTSKDSAPDGRPSRNGAINRSAAHEGGTRKNASSSDLAKTSVLSGGAANNGGPTSAAINRSAVTVANANGRSATGGTTTSGPATNGGHNTAADNGAVDGGGPGAKGAAEHRLHPAMLPAAVPGFAGRATDLAALSRIAELSAPVAISGTAGIGKTALAVHWSRQHSDGFPDGQFYLNLRGFDPAGDPLAPAEALRVLLDALGVPAAEMPGSLDGRQSLYRALSTRKRALVVLDNARDAVQVRPLLAGSPSVLVLITSRCDLAGLVATDGARLLPLDLLPDSEARDLLAQRLGPARLAAEPIAAADLVRFCAGLPLALAITAARVAARPSFSLAVIATDLRDARYRLCALTTGEDATDIRSVFSWSYQQLSGAAARMFRLLGLHPGPDASVEAAASMAGLSLAPARTALHELASRNLLTEPVSGRFTCHDLLRAYAAEQAEESESEADRDAAIRRLLQHYLHSARGAVRRLTMLREPVVLPPVPPGVTPEHFTSQQEALTWLHVERRVLLAGAALAAKYESEPCAWQLPCVLTPFLDQQGYWQECAAVQRIAVAAAAGLHDVMGQAITLRLLARTCTRLGDYEQADTHLEQSLMLYRQLGDHSGEARVHQNACVVCERQGRYVDALRHAEQAHALAKVAADRTGQANALNDIGWYHALLGNYEQARTFCEQSVGLHRDVGDSYGQARSWDSLGYAEYKAGRLAEATDCFEHALALSADVGARFYEAEVLTHLGDARQAAGDAEAARAAFERALAILTSPPHPDADQLRDKLERLAALAPTTPAIAAGPPAPT